MAKTTCAAWDGGAIANGIERLFGSCPPRQTTKTVCGRRRALSQIDNEHPTCPECRAELLEREIVGRLVDEALATERER